jgi:hypothetical protein
MVSVFLSMGGLNFGSQHDVSALHPQRNPRSRKADTFIALIASHSV